MLDDVANGNGISVRLIQVQCLCYNDCNVDPKSGERNYVCEEHVAPCN
jgi:hypothetical protein